MTEKLPLLTIANPKSIVLADASGWDGLGRGLEEEGLLEQSPLIGGVFFFGWARDGAEVDVAIFGQPPAARGADQQAAAE